MIKKVAISQAFRLCFPLEIGGMPYTADEMPDNIENAEVIPEQKQPEVKTPPEKSFKEKASELPEIAKANGILDFAEFAKFVGISKGMPTQGETVKLFVAEPDIFLEEIKRYLRSIEEGLSEKDPDGLPF